MAAQPVLVQSAGRMPCAANCLVTMPAPSAPGDTLLLVVMWQQGPLSPVVDSLGDRFVAVGTQVAGVGSGYFDQSYAQLFASTVGDAGVVSVPLVIDGGALVDALLVEFANFVGPGVPERAVAAADVSPSPDSGALTASPGALVFGYLIAADTVLNTTPDFTVASRFDADLYVFATPPRRQDFTFTSRFSTVGGVSWVAGLVSLLPSGADGGSGDAGVVDAGALDGGSFDAGALDAGTLDAGTLDAGILDAGSFDAGSLDAGQADGGTARSVLTVGCQATAGSGAWGWLAIASWCVKRRSRR